MDISTINSSVPAIAASTSPAPVDNSASANRDVVQAVKSVNSSGTLGENVLTFQRDPETHRMVIKIVNKKTQETVEQIPPEYVLALAEDLKQNNG